MGMLAKTMKAQPAKEEKRPNRPMPTDPKDLARAMFRQADHKMFGGRAKKRKAQPPSLPSSA